MKERPEYDLKESGKRLRKLRKSSGLSVEDVRTYMKLASPQAIYKWEEGINFPTADNLLALAELYKVCAEEMLVKMVKSMPMGMQEPIMMFGINGIDYVISA